MAETGWVSFGSCVHVAGAGLDWWDESGEAAVAVDAVLADDSKLATFVEVSGASTDILRITNSDVAGLIPAGSTITNRQIRFKRHRSLVSVLAVTQISVSLWLQGAAAGGPQVTVGDWPNIADVQTLLATLHDQTVTRDQIIAANTGLQLVAALSAGATGNFDPTHFVGLCQQNITFNAPAADGVPDKSQTGVGINVGL